MGVCSDAVIWKAIVIRKSEIGLKQSSVLAEVLNVWRMSTIMYGVGLASQLRTVSFAHVLDG
jgi:hypothetical protein